MVLVSGPREATLETFMQGTYDSVSGSYVVGTQGFSFTRNQTDFNAGSGGQGAEFQTQKSWSGSYAGNPLVKFKLDYVNNGVQAFSQANVYDIALTFSGTCYLGNGTARGMLFHDAANARVFATAFDVVPSPAYEIKSVVMFAGPKVP